MLYSYAPRKRLCTLVAWMICLSAAIAQAEPAGTVEKKPPVEAVRTFDSAHPPKAMPHLKHGEAACTAYEFTCDTRSTYRVLASRQTGRTWTVTIQVEQVQVTLGLNVTLWLPPDVPVQLRQHEQGHRRIVEAVYKTGEATAQSAARRCAGRRFRATGDSEEAATRAASDLVGKAMIDGYMTPVSNYASLVGDIYDRLTDHGRHRTPASDDAVTQAFSQYEQQKPRAAR